MSNPRDNDDDDMLSTNLHGTMKDLSHIVNQNEHGYRL